MSKLNSEFNYRYQVIGETVWAKIQTLHGFLDGRLRAAVDVFAYNVESATRCTAQLIKDVK